MHANADHLLPGVPICMFFNTPTGCSKGDSCRFQHVKGENAAWRRPCSFFNSAAGCSKEASCRFAHTKASATELESPPKRAKKAPPKREFMGGA